MGINVVWDDEAHTIIRYDFVGDWQYVDFVAAVAISDDMMSGVSYEVDFIANFVAGPLPSIRDFARIASTRETSPPNLGLIVVVGAGEFAQLMMEIFGRFHRKLKQQMILVGSLDEARAELALRHRDKLIKE